MVWNNVTLWSHIMESGQLRCYCDVGVHFWRTWNVLIQIFGIGLRQAIQVCDQSGFNDNIKVNKLTKYKIDQIIKIINQNYLVDSKLEKIIQRDIKQLMNIGCYRDFRHNARLPLRV